MRKGISMKKVKFAWKYRRPLWKYRKLIAHRREIAGAAIAAAAILVLTVVKLTGVKRAPATEQLPELRADGAEPV